MSNSITAVVLTKNEGKNIKRCLDSLTFCDHLLVIDDYSGDNTLNIVNDLIQSASPKAIKNNIEVSNFNSKLKILQRKLTNDFAGQRNFAMEKTKDDWILFIDADEEVSPELRKNILDSVKKKDMDAFYIKRRDFWWGNELKYGETSKIRNKGIIRLVKQKSGKWFGNVHEVFHTGKRTGTLQGYLNHFPHAAIKEFLEDINEYSTLRAEYLFRQGRKTNILEIIMYPAGKFMFNYFFKAGFLDGASGFGYSFMMSFHSFLVRSKLFQFQLENKPGHQAVIS